MTAWYNAERVAIKGSVVLAKWVAERAAQKANHNTQTIAKAARSYAGADFSRLTSDWNVLNTSADSEIVTSLRALRARSRQLVRDNEHAKNAVRIVKNNVIGMGVGMQAQVANARGKLQSNINDAIEAAHKSWAERTTCHTAGLLNLADIERLLIGQLVEAGEVLVRKVRQPFGGGTIPFALEVIEADRLMDQWQTAQAPNGNAIRMGVEIDQWGRPVAYWLHPTHPGDYQFRSFQPAKFIRVPAEDIIHLYIIDRWPQTRGEPWFHAILKPLHDMHGYGDAEIVAARASANVVGFIRTPEPSAGDEIVNAQRVLDTEPGQFRTLLPGEDFIGFAPSRPNSGLEPFMRYMLRSVAAGIGCSYESLSRDYSQSNYSSSRLALLDDRDLWRVLQSWFIANFRLPIYRDWMDAAVLAGQIKVPDYYTNREKYQRVRFKPRGWQWIDPTKEVAAFRDAVRCGFMTVSDVISQTNGGTDAEEVFKGRREELDMMAEQNLVFDTDPAQVTGKGQAQASAQPKEDAEPTEDPKPDTPPTTPDDADEAAPGETA